MSAAIDFTPGFFGKLPALGDFVQRRLPRTLVNEWDGWLQASIAGSKAQLGEYWLDTYLSSPVWHFALLPGIAGDHGWGGVMMPSVDRVGRYFPLTIAAAVPPEARVFALIEAYDWYTQAESTVLSGLEDQGFDLDAFDQSVAQLGECFDAEVALPVTDNLATLQNGWQIELSTINTASDALRGVAEIIAQDRFGKLSLWWTSGSELIAPSLLVCAGLPDPQSYSAMLDGRWRESNWQESSTQSLKGTDAESTTDDAAADTVTDV